VYVQLYVLSQHDVEYKCTAINKKKRKSNVGLSVAILSVAILSVAILIVAILIVAIF
jgi:hypothetical protein